MSFTATTTVSRLFSLSTTTPKPSLFHLSNTTATILRRSSFTPSLSLPTPSLHLKPLLRFSSSSAAVTAAISPGTKLPDATFSYLDASNEVKTLTTADLTASKKSIIFAVPGAFTPTCSQKHVPSFIQSAAALKSKGVDLIACVSINDAFVMKAWKDSLGASDSDGVLFLSDVNGAFTKAIGAELDLTDKPVGLGVRSRRYAMLVDDGVVTTLNLEEGGAFTFSGAEDMLKLL